jgi:DNA/RNA non-specific endonuclease
MEEKISYPIKKDVEELLSVFSDEELISKVGIDKVELMEGYRLGSLIIKSENLSFNQRCFNDEIQHNIENEIDEIERPILGRVKISNETIFHKDESCEKLNKGKNKYSGTIFHTGHILGAQLVCSIKDFDYSTGNPRNIFPQSEWSNQGNHKESEKVGINQTMYENEIRKYIEDHVDAHIYYQVQLLYFGKDEVPRFIHIQAFSDDKGFKKINTLIPNICIKDKINYGKWENNKKVLSGEKK